MYIVYILTRFEILRIPPVVRKWTPPCLGKIRNRRPCTAAGRRRPTENKKRYNVKYRPTMTNQQHQRTGTRNGDKSARG